MEVNIYIYIYIVYNAYVLKCVVRLAYFKNLPRY